MRRRRHINANYYLVCARALSAVLTPSVYNTQCCSLGSLHCGHAITSTPAARRAAVRSSAGSRVTGTWRPWLQALRSASQAMPDVPVVMLEDDVRIASSFALRLMSWITAIEARHSRGSAPNLRKLVTCLKPARSADVFLVPAMHGSDLPHRKGLLAGTPARQQQDRSMMHYQPGLLAAAQARAEGQPWTLYIMGMPRECRSPATPCLYQCSHNTSRPVPEHSVNAPAASRRWAGASRV